MDIAFIILAPPVLVWLCLIALPAGPPFFIGLAAFLLIWFGALGAVYPIGPGSGPDDWFRGIEVVPVWASLATAGMASAAQLWRWQRIRKNKRTHYLTAVFGIPAALAGLFLLIVIF